MHERKEIENYLLVPAAIDRASARRVLDRAKRTGISKKYSGSSAVVLDSYSNEKKNDLSAQAIDNRRRYLKLTGAKETDKTIIRAALDSFESGWSSEESRLRIIPGKDALSEINRYLQKSHDVSVTPTAIIDAMNLDEIPNEMKTLISVIAEFARRRLP